MTDATMGAVAETLRQRGYDAEWWHSGGGIMVIKVEANNLVWCCGDSDETVGMDCNNDDWECLGSYESTIPSKTEDATAVADWVVETINGRS